MDLWHSSTCLQVLLITRSRAPLLLTTLEMFLSSSNLKCLYAYNDAQQVASDYSLQTEFQPCLSKRVGVLHIECHLGIHQNVWCKLIMIPVHITIGLFHTISSALDDHTFFWYFLLDSAKDHIMFHKLSCFQGNLSSIKRNQVEMMKEVPQNCGKSV